VQPLQQLAIFGPGLIGGSIALAARRRGLCGRLSVWSRDADEREAARRLVLGDVITDDPAEAVRGADLVILCVPPAPMAALARRIAPHLDARAAVCDVASVKGGLAGELSAIFQQADERSRYVGAHPMAGSERHGLSAARDDLFENAVCLMTPTSDAAPDALETVSAFWRNLGARVRSVSPQEHDEAVALVSHLPHVLAAALVSFVSEQPDDPMVCAGPGWRDTTRVAAGSPELWTEILSHNRAPITKALHGMIAKLREVLNHLEAGREIDLQRFLAEASRRRVNHAAEGR
jgi:prephenate dehydrogenase